MAAEEPDRPRCWTEIDEQGVPLGPTFTGTTAELQAHLLRDLPEASLIADPRAEVYLRHLGTSIPCCLVTLTTPWSGNRWIPAPPRGLGRPRHPSLLRRIIRTLG